MALHGSVGRLVFIGTAGGYQHGGHHGQIAVGRRHHIGHHITVIVLAGPDEASFRADDPCHRIVYQCIEIFYTKLLKFLLVLGIIDLLKDILECMVIFLGNGILGGEPQVLLGINSISKAGSGKAGNGLFRIVDALKNSRSLKVMDQLSDLGSVLGGKYQLRPARSGHFDLRVFIDVPVSVAGNGDWLLPVAHIRDDSLHQNRRPEHSAV